MRGSDRQQADMYSYLSPEERVRANHPLRAIRAMADKALNNMSERFDAMYAKTGRPSIPPEKLLRAQLIQMLYSVRSERLFMEEIERWSDDSKYENRPIPSFAERRKAAVAKYRRRMDSAAHEISAQLAGYATRRHFAAVYFDERDHSYLGGGFPWFRLREMMKEKLDARGIMFTVVSGDSVEQPREPLTEEQESWIVDFALPVGAARSPVVRQNYVRGLFEVGRPKWKSRLNPGWRSTLPQNSARALRWRTVQSLFSFGFGEGNWKWFPNSRQCCRERGVNAGIDCDETSARGKNYKVTVIGPDAWDPRVKASQINQHLLRYTPADRFATAVFIELSRDSGELTYVNAGHNAPIVFYSGATTVLEATGMPLGLLRSGVLSR
jgi:Stage II sporulation protein E (SpoIIE)/Transposase domain (DUF772)